MEDCTTFSDNLQLLGFWTGSPDDELAAEAPPWFPFSTDTDQWHVYGGEDGYTPKIYVRATVLAGDAVSEATIWVTPRAFNTCLFVNPEVSEKIASQTYTFENPNSVEGEFRFYLDRLIGQLGFTPPPIA